MSKKRQAKDTKQKQEQVDKPSLKDLLLAPEPRTENLVPPRHQQHQN